ncbi:nitroreductase family protein [Methanobrevibacter sp.]|uniref:nitroreductase family protein n=1 Tax=Methanobrevibacter sp. TaxID=66852 RepID=UPI00386AE702
MNLEKQIYTRKSCRKYLDDEIDLNLIHDFMNRVKQLNEGVNYHYEILTLDDVNNHNRFSAPYYLAIFADRKENYIDMGFIFQQLCLYLQSIGIGNCWVGIDAPKEKSSDFVISIAFGKSDDFTRSRDKFKRKHLSKISDMGDERLIPAQLAPSAINMQPWYFKHSADGFDVYQVKHNILKRQIVKKWNPIDVGIALAHMYVANEDTFEFYKKTDFENIKGHTYVGSIKI